MWEAEGLGEGSSTFTWEILPGNRVTDFLLTQLSSTAVHCTVCVRNNVATLTEVDETVGLRLLS